MNFEIVKIKELSGKETSIYSIYVEEYGETLFDRFIRENEQNFPSELDNILDRLDVIGFETGAREDFFKLREGKPGDGVCALHDRPNDKLRLYCIRYGMDIIILGGGGEKSYDTRAWQDDEKLTEEAELIINISAYVTEMLKEGDISYTDDGKDFKGEGLKQIDDEE